MDLHSSNPCCWMVNCSSYQSKNSAWSESCSVVSDSVTPCYGILQARILEWVAIPFSRGSSRPRDWTQVSWLAGRFITVWATREAPHHVTEHTKTQWHRDFLGGSGSPMQRTWVQSLVGELRSCMFHSQQNKPAWNRSNVITNPIKTLNMVCIQKKILKKP